MQRVVGELAARPDRARRYSFELPVEAGELRGVTCDVSVTGLRLELPAADAAGLAPGDGLHLVVRFPHRQDDACLHVHGRVVRVERTAGGMSVAVAFKGFGFE